MITVDENTKPEQFRKLLPIHIKSEIEIADQCIDNHTTPHWQNLNYFYKVIDILEPSQRHSIIMHRELIREQIRADNTVAEQQKENLSYKATLLVLRDAFEHKLPTLHGDYESCGKQCDYAKYADLEYVDQMAQQLLAQAASNQNSDSLQR